MNSKENKNKVSYQELETQVAELEEMLLVLEERLGTTKKIITLQRDVMIKHLLQGAKTIDEIAELMNITNKNVSSLKHQIVNLRNKDKKPIWDILVDSKKRMHIMKNVEPVNAVS